MALPINETTEVPISTTTNTNALDTSSFAPITMIMATEFAVTKPLPIDNACPLGTTRAQNGKCEVIEVSTTAATLLESSTFLPVTTITPEVAVTVVVPGKVGKIEDCQLGTVRGQNGQCQPVELSTSTEAHLESSSLSTETIPTIPTGLTTEQMLTTEAAMLTTEKMLTTEQMLTNEKMLTTEAAMLTTEVNTVAASTEAAVEPLTTTQVNDIETTELNEVSGKQINLSQCPTGTKRDDDGSCQEIVRSNQTRTTDPKVFLKKDGSCPDGYRKLNNDCLYIGSKVVAPVVPGGFNPLDRVQPKSGSDESSNLNQLVRTNDDGSCPAGTQHYENGLCIIMNQPLTPSLNSKITCGDSYELVNGKCVRKSFLQQNHQLESSSPSIIATTEQANTDDKLVEPKVSVDLTTAEMMSEKKLRKMNTQPRPKPTPPPTSQ